MQRNPYLVDYEQERLRREQGRLRVVAGGARTAERRYESRSAQTARSAERRPASRSPQTARSAERRPESRSPQTARTVERRYESRRAQAVRARRRRQVRRRRIAVGIWLLCMVLFGALMLLKNGNASAAEGTNNAKKTVRMAEERLNLPTTTVQGISAAQYAKHPDWTEDFLTPNEYSRPGEPLEQVSNIFVHYTANPGTSAAQNRSYFEQQKDTHEASVSSHFIIGYEGEVLQCLPLDEIGYAVQSRNYDSISIECCFKAKDGSFTQETYDSLISLLAWLIETYDLKEEDILRHYDCGGKKCPIYYTENPKEWEQLKADVAAARR